MTETEHLRHPLPLAGFIAHLKSRGFVIGVDQHLRLQAVLEMIGPETPPADVKYLLCPVFATTAKQQNRFYRAFDRYFHFLLRKPVRQTAAHPQKTPETEKTIKTPLFARLWVVAFAGIIAFVAIGMFTNIGEKFPEPDKPLVIPPPPEQQQPPKVQKNSAIRTVTTLNIGTILEPPTTNHSEKAFWLGYLRWLGIAAPWLILLLLELHRIQKQRLLLCKRWFKKPPFFWRIQVDAPDPAFLKSQTFYAAARKLRQRIVSGDYRLDIPKTVAKAAVGAGFVMKFHYKPLTRPAEYLFLIDLPTYRDHQARLFEILSIALEKEDIDVTRYFFRNDPQICFQTVGGMRVELSEIQAKHGHKRLVIFGDAGGLFDPVTGEMESWIDIFKRFPQMAIMTPRLPAEWGTQEVALARSFFVLPATMEGMNTLVDHFDYPAGYHLRYWVRTRKNIPFVIDPENPAELRARLGEDTFQWLCACAVYPEIHWNLTLHLGMMFGHDLSGESIARLIRLPWFRQGGMPETLRLKLIDQLSPEQLHGIRRAIYDILEENPPNTGSAAWDEYRLYLAAYSGRKKGRRGTTNLKKILKNAGQARFTHDITLLQLLESQAAGPLALVLPRHLKQRFSKLLFRNGLSFFGLKTRIRALLALTLCVAAFSLIPVPEKKSGEQAQTIATPVTLKLVYVPSKVGFYYQASPITWNQWAAVMKDEASATRPCGACPREPLTIDDMRQFTNRLNAALGATDYRPATEADRQQAVASGTVPEAPSGVSFARVARPLRASDYVDTEPAPGTTINGPFGMTFAYIPAGSFLMGSPETEKGRTTNESPRHIVTIPEGFYMQTTEVTQRQWEAVMGTVPSHFWDCGLNCPVERVSWNDAQAFIKKLNEKERRNIYRLPTEAEWEYAARAGSTTAFANGGISNVEENCNHDHNLDEMGWYCGNSNVTYDTCADASGWGGVSCAGIRSVAQKTPNDWGLHDMHGNVYEWCEDDWHDTYNAAPSDSSAWIDNPKRGNRRVMRGCSWGNFAQRCRSAYRYKGRPSLRVNYVGFRIVRYPP